MNGAESLVQTLLNCGVDTCFANPGTSEMHFVAALDRIPGIRCVLGLEENIVTGMADGYYRIARKPACTLLHCGPGFANGIANLHNARRARAGIVNVVGDQATYHRPYDAPLTADTEGLARTVSHWVRTSARAADVGRDAAAAVQAALTAPGQIATLILPADASWESGGVIGEALPVPKPAEVDGTAIETAARLLRSGAPVLLLLADPATQLPSQRLAWQVAQATGASIMANFSIGQMTRGRGCVPIERVPYVTDAAIQVLEPFRHIILVNAKAPVGFFAYPGKPSLHCSPQASIHVLTRPEQDPIPALQALVEALGAPPVELPDPGPRPEIPRGSVTPEGLATALAAVMPEQAIVTNESISFGRNLYKFTHAAPEHDWLELAGGAIGDGIPLATGAAIGARGTRRVISLQADGSALYSPQSLWTQARERLPCTTILLNNGKYRILIDEYKNVGVGGAPGPTASGMLDLSAPAIDWVRLANSFGVDAERATTLERCAELLLHSFKRSGPFLIDLQI